MRFANKFWFSDTIFIAHAIPRDAVTRRKALDKELKKRYQNQVRYACTSEALEANRAAGYAWDGYKTDRFGVATVTYLNGKKEGTTEKIYLNYCTFPEEMVTCEYGDLRGLIDGKA